MNHSEEEDMFCNPNTIAKVLIVKQPSNALYINHIVLVVANIILFIPTITLNAISILTILKSSQLKNKTCYFVILLQSAADLTVGVLGIPFHLVYLSSGIGGILDCFMAELSYKLVLTTLGASMATLLGMTLERYIAVLHPFAYNKQVTKNRILFLVVLAVISDILSVILSFVMQLLLEIGIGLTVTVMLTSTAFAYTKIYLVIARTVRSHRIHDAQAAEEILTRKARFLQNVKRVKSCFLVVICYFFLSFLPVLVAFVFSFKMSPFLQEAFQNWSVTLSILNSSANSVIFFWTKTMLSREALKMLKSIFENNQ